MILRLYRWLNLINLNSKPWNFSYWYVKINEVLSYDMNSSIIYLQCVTNCWFITNKTQKTMKIFSLPFFFFKKFQTHVFNWRRSSFFRKSKLCIISSILFSLSLPHILLPNSSFFDTGYNYYLLFFASSIYSQSIKYNNFPTLLSHMMLVRIF